MVTFSIAAKKSTSKKTAKKWAYLHFRVRISGDGAPREKSIGIKIRYSDWDATNQRILKTADIYHKITLLLKAKKSEMENRFFHFEVII